MAAKLEEPREPRAQTMVNLLLERHDLIISRDKILDLEASIIYELDFDFRHTSPVPFLERFQRIFSLDREDTNPTSKAVGEIARKYCRFMLIRTHFLDFKPS